MYMKFIRAFTFVELIITMAILAIIASFALPHFHEYMSKLESQTTHKKITTATTYSRAQAALLRQNIVICPSATFSRCEPYKWSTGYLIFVDTNRNRQLDPNEQLMHIEQLNLKYANLEWRGTLAIQSVTYQGHSALPIGSNGSFFYCSYDHKDSKRIYLSKMGITRMEKISQC